MHIALKNNVSGFAAGLLMLTVAGSCASKPTTSDARLADDWDYYVMLGAAPNGGFEAARRMGEAHFDGPSADGAWLKGRSGASMNAITKVSLSAPAIATADPLRIVPYIDMVFSPTIVPWLCVTGVKDTLSDISNVHEVEAFNHLPVIDAADTAGCPRRQFWNDWFDHDKEDAFWRGLSIERRLDRVKVPVLGIAGWHDDARGTIRNYTAMSRLPNAPVHHVVMDPGAHKGIDYVNGDFGPQARIDHRALHTSTTSICGSRPA
jgi:pimeloyl-ACP methyl ester carboxylesterase